MDEAFFGSIYERRKRLRQAILDKHPEWHMHFGHNLKQQVMVKAYQDAKVCLVAHSINATTGGEYHRLSEFAAMGCVPVMEAFSDTIAIDDYVQCGGVVFAPYNLLISSVESVLKDIDGNQRDNMRYVAWWKHQIQWDNVIMRMLGERESSRRNASKNGSNSSLSDDFMRS